MEADGSIYFLECIKANFDECYPGGMPKAILWVTLILRKPLCQYAKELGKMLVGSILDRGNP